MYTVTSFENLEGKDNSEEAGIHGKIILEWILGTESGIMWTGCIRHKKGTISGPLCTW
jgi:hypothetical protein